MTTITQSALFGVTTCRAIALTVTLVVTTFVLAGTASAAAAAAAPEPTLKDVIKKPEEKKKPAGEKELKGGEKDKPTKAPPGPIDEFNRGVPRTSVEGFLKAARALDYKRAAQYLQLPTWLDKAEGPQLARHLRIVFDRVPLWIDLNGVSDRPAGHANDGLPPIQDRLSRIKTPERTVDILLERVSRPDGVSIWKFSSTTIAEISWLYDEFGYGALGEILPALVFDLEFLGIQVWLWVGILVLLIVAYFAALVATKIVIFFVNRTKARLSDQAEKVIRGPARLLFFVLIGRAGIDLLGPSVTLRAALEGQTLLLVAIAWLIIGLLESGIGRIAERLRRSGQGQAIVLLPTVTNALKFIVIGVAALVWLDNIGVKVTTLLAGLGLGGLALALGLQKSIENVVGAVSLLTLQPVRVGDFCRFGSTVGTVEEIGLNATRVRTLDRTVVNVPNAQFSNLHLDNFTRRDKIWYHPRIRLRYDTTPDQIRYILVEVRKLLYSHPKVSSDPARIRFEEFGVYSLDLGIFAYITVTDFDEFLEIAEDLNLRIMDVVAKGGAKLTLPSQTTYLENGLGADQPQIRGAEEQVRKWRDQNELYLPRFPQEKIAELQGSLEYPPIGSPGLRS